MPIHSAALNQQGAFTNIAKGQLISKWLFGVIVWKKSNDFFSRIFALPSKNRSSQKNEFMFLSLFDFLSMKMLSFFWLDRLVQKVFKKLVGFSLDFKISWHLVLWLFNYNFFKKPLTPLCGAFVTWLQILILIRVFLHFLAYPANRVFHSPAKKNFHSLLQIGYLERVCFSLSK